MKHFVLFVSEGPHLIHVGSCDTLEEAKAKALKKVDDALPQNTVHVFEDLGHAYLAGDGGEAWQDRKKE